LYSYSDPGADSRTNAVPIPFTAAYALPDTRAHTFTVADA